MDDHRGVESDDLSLGPPNLVDTHEEENIPFEKYIRPEPAQFERQETPEHLSKMREMSKLANNIIGDTIFQYCNNAIWNTMSRFRTTNYFYEDMRHITLQAAL